MMLETELADSRTKLDAAIEEAEANLASLKITLAETITVQIKPAEYPTREHYKIAKSMKKITVNEVRGVISKGTALLYEYRQLAKSAMSD